MDGHTAAVEAVLAEERARDQLLSETLEKLRADVEDFADRLGTANLGSFAGIHAENAQREGERQKVESFAVDAGNQVEIETFGHPRRKPRLEKRYRAPARYA